MNGDGYRLLGFVVWQGGRWYLRRRVPSMRRLALRGAGALVALTVAAVLAKRLAS
ncbi:MAG: hypothetical protein ACLPUT_15995 [Solirubrobacteraceae bacterium]